MRWEYLFVVGMLNADGAWQIAAVNGQPEPVGQEARFSAYLNERGAEGWELVQVLYGAEMGLSLVFKRQAAATAPGQTLV